MSWLYNRFYPRYEQDPETKECYTVSYPGARRVYDDSCEKCLRPIPHGEEYCEDCREDEDEL